MRRSLVSLRLLFCVLTALLLGATACSSKLKPPTAEIGDTPSSVVVGAQLVLDGTASHDPNGWALQYRWRLIAVPAGSTADVHAASAATAWFSPDVSGEYTVELMVSDGTLTSAPATATLTAGPCGGNLPTVTNIAYSPASPNAGSAIVLASNAHDADMDAACSAGDALDFHWSLVNVPPGSAAMLNDPSASTPSFVSDVPGAYTVRLSVSDRAGHASAAIEQSVNVGGCVSGVPVITQVSSTPSSAVIGQPVTLQVDGFLDNPIPEVPDAGAPGTGGASTDGGLGGNAGAGATSNGGAGGSAGAGTAGSGNGGAGGGAPVIAVCADTPLTYHWTLIEVPAGSAVSLVDSPEHKPSFVPDVAGSYVVEVYLTNPDGVASQTETLTLTVGTCGGATPSVTRITATPAAPASGQTVSLAATIDDADTASPCSLTERYEYRWALRATPAGSSAQLSAAAATPWFTADLPGRYTVELVVVDSEGHVSAPKTLDVTAGACGSNAPSVTAVRATPGSPNVDSVVSLSATVTDADTSNPCNQTERLSLEWAITSRPSGSQASLSSPTEPSPWFTADVAGTYQVQAIATDAAGHTSAPRTLSITVSACGSASPSIDSVSVAPASPVAGSGVSVSASVSDSDTAASCGLSEQFSYLWSLTAVPAGSTTTIADRTAPIASFTPDRAGTFTLSLVVTDSEGHASSTSTRSITVAPACGQAAPVALLAGITGGACPGTCTAATLSPTPPAAPNAAPPNYTITLNGHSAVLLDGTASNDPDNSATCNAKQTLFWSWSILAAPVGSKANFSIAGATSTLATPTFNVDLAGIYQVRLIVSDGKNQSAPLVIQLTF